MPATQLRFDRYVLDLEHGSLRLDGTEIALRPKTFAVLGHLVRNGGRLVSKDELFAAVWPGLVVTDDALVQCIGELRRALGDEGQRLIKTIPRRGYRFEPAVSKSSAPPESAESGAGTGNRIAVNDTGSPPAESNDIVHPGVVVDRSTRRVGVLVASSVAVVLAAAAIWSGVATDWKSRSLPASGGSSAAAKPDRSAKAAIAVLPFVNRGSDAGREYFADGLTQDIISALGRYSELTVMSWNAVFRYKGNPASPEEIARSLAVQYQVEGTVLPAGDRVRVNAQLVNAGGHVLWSARYDEALSDLFALQGKITTEIAGALAIRVTEFEQNRASAKPPENLEAYDFVLRARPALQRPTRANNVEARALLRRALEVDPNCAPAYAALAETFHVAVAMGWAESPVEFLKRAEEMANQALGIDRAQARAHLILGRIHIFFQRYDQALAEVEQAIAANPSDAHALAGRGNTLMWLGQTDAAIEALELAQRIDPELNAIDRFALSLAYYLKRRYDLAIQQAELNLRGTASANFSRSVLAAAYAQHNQVEDATRLADVIRRTDPTFDPQAFGSKLMNRTDQEHLHEGFRKAGLLAEAGAGAGPSPR